MRIISALLLMTSGLALTACGGGGELSGASFLANKAGVCTIQEKCTVPGGTSTASADSDGDGIPDSVEGAKDGINDGNTGSGAGGNNTSGSAGNRTVALQLFKLSKPTAGSKAISQLSATGYTDMQAVENAILSTNKPSKLKFSVNTNNANNSQWAVPAEMNEDLYGTRDLRWIALGHTTPAFATYSIVDHGGNPIVYDATNNTFRYTATTTFGDETFSPKEEVDYQHDDFYWNQIKVYMGSKANAGAKDNYREYRIKDQETNRDELLQVWSWNNSYAVQYQNQIIQNDAKQQAWTFGGNETVAMPTTGKSKYAGRFAATAKIEGWKKNKIPGSESDIEPNTVWKVQGRSEVTADFGTSSVSGILTPETWTSFQTKPDAYYTWYTSEAALPAPGNTNHSASIETGATPDYKFYSTKIKLNGTIVEGDTTTTSTVGGVTTTSKVNNAIAGANNIGAQLQGFTNGDNDLQAGFYGTTAQEMTGAFSVTGTATQQIGGTDGQIQTFTGRETISGIFNGQCTPGVTCAP